ncbi:MAG: type II toxin-antitoxin system Y4mF family antitoxin [Frankia sp.]
MQLGRAVRLRRQSLGLRQEQLADLAGCSERFVHTLETGKATVRLDKVLDVLTTLGLTLTVGRGRSGGVATAPELDALMAGIERFS